MVHKPRKTAAASRPPGERSEKPFTPEAVRLCTLSVISQCVFYRNSAAVVSRLYPEIVPAREVQRLADHVTRFSLAAMQGLARNGKDGS